MSARIPRYLLVVFALCVCLALAACDGNAATSVLAPTGTQAPELEPTATLAPPSATPIPTATSVPPSATSVPPTKTPLPTATPVTPTATPLPPTKAVNSRPRAATTPKPAATKGTTGGGVSSQPSTLQKSAQQALDTVLAMTGILDQMLQGGAELCAPLLEKHQSLHNAPQYDMSNQAVQMQQAYALYRQGIDLVDSEAAKMQACGHGGGSIGRNDSAILHRTFAQAASLFGQAIDLTKRAGGVSPSMPLADVVARVRAAMSYVGRVFQGGGQCAPFIDEYNILANAPSYDVSAQPANVQTAYGLYRHALEIAIPKVMLAVDTCNAGGGSVNKLDYEKALPVLREAEGLLIQAVSLLGQ